VLSAKNSFQIGERKNKCSTRRDDSKKMKKYDQIQRTGLKGVLFCSKGVGEDYAPEGSTNLEEWIGLP